MCLDGAYGKSSIRILASPEKSILKCSPIQTRFIHAADSACAWQIQEGPSASLLCGRYHGLVPAGIRSTFHEQHFKHRCQLLSEGLLNVQSTAVGMPSVHFLPLSIGISVRWLYTFLQARAV